VSRGNKTVEHSGKCFSCHPAKSWTGRRNDGNKRVVSTVLVIPLETHDYTYFTAGHDRCVLLTISAEETSSLSLYLVLLSFLITMAGTRSISPTIVRMLNGKTS
jgi:hypothetical protein